MDKIETPLERRRRLARNRKARWRAARNASSCIKMPSHCCVPFCNANYPSGPKVSVFSFPKEAILLKKWLAAIPKEDLIPLESTKVCQKHFKPEDIITETSAFDTKKQVTITVQLKNHRLKPDAVPCIFEDIPIQRVKKVNNSPKEKQEKDNSDGTSVQSKGTKSPSVSETGALSRQDGERKGSFKSPKKATTTTDRPIIAVIKAEDLIVEEDKSPEEMEDVDDKEEDEDDVIEVDSPNSAPLSSPFKNMPNVSVCLKEEDRVPVTRELKGVKRSPSTGSNSSTGSSDAQKSNISAIKRRKIEKPAPVVIGRQNDCYCWVCHRENIILCCIACPRAFHPKCAGDYNLKSSDWVCPECQKILAAENVDTRSSTLAEISLDKLGALLKLSLNKMKQRAPIAFHQPVSLDHYPLYLHYVIHPMDFSLLEKNIKQKLYGCTEAFLADVKWISHNSCVFNGTQHPLSTNAKNLVKACDQDMQEIEVCPDCFVHSVVRNKYWFSDVCRKPHPLVWAKLKGFPYWPAKVVRILDGNVDARFFGAHDRAWVPVSQCYHLSKEMPTTSKPKKKGNYEVALDELNVHVHLLIQEFGCFEYAPYRTSFNTENKHLMYHGIDVDKVAKKEISFDISSPVPEKYHSSEKENRFASFLESEQEKSNSDETKSSEKSENLMKNPFKVDDGVKSPFFFSERKSTDSLLSEKETVESESSQEKSTLEDKINYQKKTVELKKTDTVQVSPIKISEKVSASDQFRKLELALERIKGYVSLTAESEKENESQSEDKEENKKGEEKGSSPEKKEETKSSTLSPLFKETIKLPEIETNSVEETSVDVTKLLEPSRKTDSFVLKLNETIESCKAKLGISEIIDDSSDESGADENASRSEDEEDNSSSSEAEEESSDEEVEDEDDGESEVMEISDEESDNGNKGNELDSKLATDEDDNSKSGDESGSESSGTDIETHTNDASPKRADNINIVIIKDSESDIDKNRDVMKDNSGVTLGEDGETSILNSDMQVAEVTVNDSGPLEVIDELTSGESSKHGKTDPSDKESNQTNYPLTLSPSQLARIRSAALQHNTKQTNCKDKSEGSSNTDILVINENSSPLKMTDSILLENNADKKLDKPDNEGDIPRNSSIVTPKNDSVEDDDDIFICTPTRPKSPPVIVLDDDVENEDSSVSDTYAVKTPPYSTSVESFSNEEIPAPSTNSGDEPDHFSPTKAAVIKRRASSESSLKRNSVLDSVEKKKRKLSSEESSDDEIQIVSPVKKVGLTGAKRTFNKANAVENVKKVSPTLDTVRRNLTKGGLEKTSPTKTTEVEETESLRSEPTQPEQSPQNILNSPVLDARNLTEHEKEVLFFKRKLQCLMTAYKIQGWKCHQEREELRHNMNLIIMEMRACLESDKKQAIDILVRTHEQEKLKLIEEAKRKQWCATCLSESRYACCWNTSYCSVDCQKRHFPEHRKTCTQVPKINKSKIEIKSSSITSDNNDGKKLIILNMKNDSGKVSAADKSISGVCQQTTSSKPEIQVLSPSNAVQLPSSSNPVQFVIAPVKSPSESNVVPSTLSFMEKNLDSAQIITHVRNKACDLGTAISLLKKKNLESTLSILSKKKEAEEIPKEDASLEDVYFPSPPKITFEGYDSVSPEPNLALHEMEEAILNCDADTDASLPEELVPERDVDLSDTDEMDNVMVSIGHSVVVKAKFLNKCLVYGKTAKKLTRCLVDIIFPDIRLLASCSAFGQKSNVTKLTRAALPARKVYAIIDFVTKRFPYATRSEIVLAINMKCKEARIMLKRNIDSEKKTATRRLLAKEQEEEIASTTTAEANTAVTVSPPTSTIVSSVPKTAPNVVCVKSSPPTLPFSMPKKPNILRCTPQLIMPKPVSSSQQAIFQTPPGLASQQANSVFQVPPQPKKRETVKELLSKQSGNAAKDGPADTSKQPSVASGVVSIGSPSIRPYIIMGTHSNVAIFNQQPSVQSPVLLEPPKK